MSRSSLVLRMVFRARKVLGTFEKRAAGCDSELSVIRGLSVFVLGSAPIGPTHESVVPLSNN